MQVSTGNKTDVKAVGAITDLGDVGIKPGSISKLFSIVTEKLYEDPIRAVTREMMTNMLDAWLQIVQTTGQEPPPGIVSLPDSFRPSITFTDYGPGLSLEDLQTYVCHILESSKDQGNDFHGGWGLGLKSPFAYTKNWSIISRHEGLQISIATYMQENGIPKVSMVGTPMPTSEPSGLTITIPVRAEDFLQFESWALWYWNYFQNESLQIAGFLKTDIGYKEEKEEVEVDGWKVEWAIRTSDGFTPETIQPVIFGTKKDVYNREKPDKDKRLRIILGQIVYPIPENLRSSALSIPVDLFFPIGSLQVTPDRDRLVAAEKQNDFITKVFAEIKKKFLKQYEKELHLSSPWKTLKNCLDPDISHLCLQSLGLDPQKVKASYSGQKIKAVFEKEEWEIEVGRNESPRYKLPKENFLKAIRFTKGEEEGIEIVTAAEPSAAPPHLHSFALRKRSYNSSKTSRQNFYSLSTTDVHSGLSAIYYDDIGPGSIKRFNSINPKYGEGISRSNAFGSEDLIWGRKPNGEVWLIVRYPDEYSNLSTPYTVSDIPAFAALLGVPEELIHPISDIEEPEIEESASSIYTPKYGYKPALSTLSKDERIQIPALQQSPMVSEFKIQNTWGNSYYSRCSWPDGHEATDGGYYVETFKGTTENKNWPETTAATAPETWNFIKSLQATVELALGDKPLIFVPSGTLKLLKKVGEWKDFFPEFDLAFKLRTEDLFPELDAKKIFSDQHLQRDVAKHNQEVLMVKDSAKEMNILLPPAFLSAAKKASSYVHVHDIIGVEPYQARKLVHHLLSNLGVKGKDPVQTIMDNTDKGKEAVANFQQSYPSLFLIRSFPSYSSMTPGVKKTFEKILKTLITRSSS